MQNKTIMTARVVYNPYSKEARAGREKEKAAKRTVETMMRNMNKPSEKGKKGSNHNNCKDIGFQFLSGKFSFHACFGFPFFNQLGPFFLQHSS